MRVNRWPWRISRLVVAAEESELGKGDACKADLNLLLSRVAREGAALQGKSRRDGGRRKRLSNRSWEA